MLLWPFNKYPGTDYETFNWEWILKTVKEWTTKMTGVVLEWAAMKIDWQNFIDHTYKDQITEILADHPEWVTTVQNGSITAEKLENYFLLSVENDYVTPQMYGAAADGVTDDTQAIQDAIDAAYSLNKRLHFPIAVYNVTDTLELPENLFITGSNVANYSKQTYIRADFGNVDKPLFTKKAGVTKTPHYVIKDMQFARVRTSLDGYDEDVNPSATGKTGICFDAGFEESIFDNLSFIGWGVAIHNTPISWYNNGDFKYCETCIKLDTTIQSNIGIDGFNVWECGTLFDVETNLQNVNVSNTWLENVQNLLRMTIGARQVLGLNFNKLNFTNRHKPGNLFELSQTNTSYSRIIINLKDSHLTVDGNLTNNDTFSSTDLYINNEDNILYISGDAGSPSAKVRGTSWTYNLTSSNKESISTYGVEDKAQVLKSVYAVPHSNPGNVEGMNIRSDLFTYRSSDGFNMTMLPVYQIAQPGVTTPTPISGIDRKGYFIFNTNPSGIGDYILAYVYNGTNVTVIKSREN